MYRRLVNHSYLKTFTLYRSSAGSGKTRTLAKEYIKLALRWQPDYFHHILAVTFTNKATQEMKERILRYLDDFANGRSNNLREEIMSELSLDEAALQSKSKEVLSGILHQYSRFSISTIDAFFQRVIRAFTREAGILGNFRLESDNDYVLNEVIAALMTELGSNNKTLTDWVVSFSHAKLTTGAKWDVINALRSFAKEILKEQFKAIEERIQDSDPAQVQRVLNVLRDEEKTFHRAMKKMADEAIAILDANQITKSDFAYGDQGTAWKYFQDFSEGSYCEVKPRILSALAGSKSWTGADKPGKSKSSGPLLRSLAETKLIPILRQMVDFDKDNGSAYHSARAALESFYEFGLIADITRKLQAYRDENNMMLLADASKFLNTIIAGSDTPFIYEKVGSYFRHHLIDEFQDTSLLQWRNFIPLLKEASDQNHTNLIVGDVKQSIYRWRGGDLELLQNGVTREFGADRIESVALSTNYRSAERVVEFNNLLFRKAASIIAEGIANPLPGEVYADVEQKKVRYPGKGYVVFNFLRRDDDEGWEEAALRQLPAWLEKLQDAGATLRDIAILVRENKEGQRIANFLLRFRQSPEAKPGYRYEVVSNESLRLDTAYSVNVLITALRLLKNPNDKVARGQLAYEWTTGMAPETIFQKSNQWQLEDILPPEFVARMRSLKNLSLFELTEELIRLFGLGKRTEELAYIQAFQDYVLEFSAREKTDINSFLDWWELYKDEKSIQVSGAVNAVRILTIHKAKGLEFNHVIIPFCSWQLNRDFSMMWVESEEKPFKDIGPVAVRYKEDLKKTLFAQAYEKEFAKVHLDNLNLLYVAFTRAEAGLIAFSPSPREFRMPPKYAGELVYRAIEADPTLAPHLKGDVFEWGSVETLRDEPEEEMYRPKDLKSYDSADWRKKLVIKRQGAEFFDESVSDKRGKINRGILLHTVLSRVAHIADADTALELYLLENALPGAEGQALKMDVQAVLHHAEMGKWFSKEWNVRTEALVLLPGGKQKRFDRIMLGKTRTVVVDYKTGERKKDDRAQIEEYGKVLTQMGYPNVEAYLAYLSDMSVDVVIKGSSLSMF